MTTSALSGAAVARSRPNGPHPGALVLVSLALTVASLAATALLADGSVYVSPFASTAEIGDHYREHGAAAQVGATLLFGSAVPLGIAAATFSTRLTRLGARVPGPSIGLFGGFAASVLLMLSALVGWTLGRPELGGDPGVLRALAFLAFLTGGTGYVVGLGLLLAGIAVPALVLRLVPRWLGWAGLVLAALAELSFLSLLLEPLQLLLPVGRFGGLVWLVAAGFALPRHRAERSVAR